MYLARFDFKIQDFPRVHIHYHIHNYKAISDKDKNDKINEEYGVLLDLKTEFKLCS